MAKKIKPAMIEVSTSKDASEEILSPTTPKLSHPGRKHSKFSMTNALSNMRRDAEEDDDIADVGLNNNRPWAIRQLRSVFVYFTVAMSIASILSVVVSTVWFTTFLIVSDGFVTNLRENSFAGVYGELLSMYVKPSLVAKSLATTIHPTALSNTTSFDDIRAMLERNVKYSSEAFIGGKQVMYATRDRALGLKQHPDPTNPTMQIYTIWNTPHSREQLPNAQHEYNDTLSYHNYINFENGTLDKTVLKSFPYAVTRLSGLNGLVALNTNTVPKQRYMPPLLSSCPTKGSTCSILQQYCITPFQDPGDGYAAIYIQLNFVSQLLKRLKSPGVDTFVIERSTNFVIGSNLQDIDVHYLWYEDKGKHDFIPGNIFPNALVQRIVAYLQSKHGSDYMGLPDNTLYKDNMMNGVSKLYVDAQRLELPGLELVVVSTVPEWQYIGTTTTIGIVLLSLSGVAFLVSLLFGLISSFVIYKPLRGLINNIGQITDGLDLERVNTKARPYFTEFDQLNSTFLYLVEKLKLYRTFLPDHILKQVDRLGDDVVEEPEQPRNSAELGTEGAISDSASIASSSISRNSTNISSSRRSEHDVGKGLLSLGLSSDKATFLSIFLHYDSAGKNSTNANMKLFSELLSIIERDAGSKHGRIESFNEQEIVIGFNSITKIKNHTHSASLVALKLQSVLQAMKSTHDLHFGMGISTGSTYMGTIGSKTKRSWRSIGPATKNASLLAKHACNLSSGILFDNAVRKTYTDKTFHFRLTDVLSLPNQKKNMNVYQLVDVVVNKYDEWFYELQNKENATWTADYVKALKCVISDELDEASAAIKSFTSQWPQDAAGLHLEHLINYLMETASSWDHYCDEMSVNHPLNHGREYISLVNHRSFTSNSNLE